jgi:hypothetical protein
MAIAAMVFDRSQISGIAGLTTAVVKHWSTGKPLSIPPSIHAPGRVGAQPLYSRDDVYKFALAAVWSGKLTFQLIQKIRPKLHAEWFLSEERGLLLIARIHEPEEPVVEHYSKKLPKWSRINVPKKYVRDLLLHGRYGTYSFDLGKFLDEIDQRIEKATTRRQKQ